MSSKVFTLRLDENLIEIIKVQSEINRRSMAKEVEFALGRYYANLVKDMQKNNTYLAVSDYLSKYDPSLLDFENEI